MTRGRKSGALRSLVAATAGALLVVVTSGVASAKTVSNKQYAKTYCGAIEGWLEELNSVETEAQAASDASSFQAAAVAAVDTLLASLQTESESLQEIAPKDGGKKVAEQFDAVLAGQAASIQAARDAFAATDPDSGAFSDAVGTLLVSGAAAADTFDEPLSKLGTHKKLRRAVKQECDIVRVSRS